MDDPELSRELLRVMSEQHAQLRQDVRDGFKWMSEATDRLAVELKAERAQTEKREDKNEERWQALGREVWVTVKGPLTQLGLAVSAYLTWQYLQAPTNPTPVQTVVTVPSVGTANAAAMPASP